MFIFNSSVFYGAWPSLFGVVHQTQELYTNLLGTFLFNLQDLCIYIYINKLLGPFYRNYIFKPSSLGDIFKFESLALGQRAAPINTYQALH